MITYPKPPANRAPWKVVTTYIKCIGGSLLPQHRIESEWTHPQLKASIGIVAPSVNAAEDEHERHGIWLEEADAQHIVGAVNMHSRLVAVADAAERLQQARAGDGDVDAADQALDIALRELHETNNSDGL